MKTLLLASLLLAASPGSDGAAGGPVSGHVDKLKAKGVAAERKLDYLSARRHFREAATLARSDASLAEQLAGVEKECLRNARRQISEAKAYLAADNEDEARKSLRLALQYADLETYPEHASAMRLLKPLGGAPPPDTRPAWGAGEDEGEEQDADESTETTADAETLPEDARALRSMAGDAERQQDFLRARTLYRAAVAKSPNDTSLSKDLARVDEECRKNAKRQISEAKAYLAADNYYEAQKALSLALKYADRETDPENKKAMELRRDIKRNTER